MKLTFRVLPANNAARISASGTNQPVAKPVGHRLTVVYQNKALLILGIPDISELDVNRGRDDFIKQIKSAGGNDAFVPPSRLTGAIFIMNGLVKQMGQIFAGLAAGFIIKKDIDALFARSGIAMDDYGLLRAR